MSNYSYIRDAKRGTLILRDPAAVAEFKSRKTMMQEIHSLKADINTLKTELEAVKRALTPSQKSE